MTRLVNHPYKCVCWFRNARTGLVCGVYKRVMRSLEAIKSMLVTIPSLWVLHLNVDQLGNVLPRQSKTDIFGAFSQNSIRQRAPSHLTVEEQGPAFHR